MKQSRYCHPLTSLSPNEIRAVAAAIRKHVQAEDDTEDQLKLRFSAISLKEPTKAELLQFYSSYDNDESKAMLSHPPRYAEVVTMNPQTGYGSEHIVRILPNIINDESDNKDGGRTVVELKCLVERTVVLPAGVQPMLTPDDCDLAERIVWQSEDVRAALKKRYNITDLDRVACDPWCIHLASDDDIAFAKKISNQTTKTTTTLTTSTEDIATPYDTRPPRLVQNFLYYRAVGPDLECNQQAHPIDIVPVVDLNLRQLVHIYGLNRTVSPSSIPPLAPVNFHRNLLHTNAYLETSFRTDVVKPLHIIQPEGPSFTVQADSNRVSWQKWSFEVCFNYREGLVLYNVKFDNRNVLHRASLVEMAVPYGDVHPPYHRKCAFDVGDYGLGYCANSLQLGCDCLGHIHYFTFHVINSKGEPVEKRNCVCMHEIDDGILWKHVEYRNNHNESRRSRVLVVSFIATVVNYEYLFYWKFKQDGTIEHEIKLTGELATNVLSVTEEDRVILHNGQPDHGLIVAPSVNSQVHQHIFCVRLNMAVDADTKTGECQNTVSELDVVPMPYDPKTNPYGNGFTLLETVLDTELNAIRTCDATKARCWKIAHSSIRNPINYKPTAYKLIPYTYGPTHPVLLADHKKSTLGTKGAFASANLWVTPYKETERYAAGDYTPQQLPEHSDGLSNWTKSNRTVTGTDVVLWHSFGLTHIPRIEDFPIMSCESTGFTLKPDNFFKGNPTIDLPPDTTNGSVAMSVCCHDES